MQVRPAAPKNEMENCYETDKLKDGVELSDRMRVPEDELVTRQKVTSLKAQDMEKTTSAIVASLVTSTVKNTIAHVKKCYIL